ncbi:MAG TPA: proton-conducting transporter membrane subunit, partial [Buchnera sp. (in: enterobacteria)]|nr:proton-conducting transporter membrane subunit [Buchnera sp. (in: enterobacteria)]
VNSLYDNNIILLLGFIFIIIAFSFKLSIIPFHLWTPDVYEGSAFLVIFFLSTASKIAVFSMLNKLFMHIPYTNLQLCYFILEILSFISIIFGNIMAIFQNNIKRLLAYSSISHMGFLLIAIVSLKNQQFALESMEIYLIGYLLTNIAMLGTLSILDTQYKIHHTNSIVCYQGLFWRDPILTIIITIMMLSFSGMPMSIGFIGKFYLMLIVANEKLFLLGLGLLLGSMIGFYYYLRIIANLYFYSPLLFSRKILQPSKLNIAHILIYISFITVIILGCYPILLIDILQKI